MPDFEARAVRPVRRCIAHLCVEASVFPFRKAELWAGWITVWCVFSWKPQRGLEKSFFSPKNSVEWVNDRLIMTQTQAAAAAMLSSSNPARAYDSPCGRAIWNTISQSRLFARAMAYGTGWRTVAPAAMSQITLALPRACFADIENRRRCAATRAPEDMEATLVRFAPWKALGREELASGSGRGTSSPYRMGRGAHQDGSARDRHRVEVERCDLHSPKGESHSGGSVAHGRLSTAGGNIFPGCLHWEAAQTCIMIGTNLARPSLQQRCFERLEPIFLSRRVWWARDSGTAPRSGLHHRVGLAQAVACQAVATRREGSCRLKRKGDWMKKNQTVVPQMAADAPTSSSPRRPRESIVAVADVRTQACPKVRPLSS